MGAVLALDTSGSFCSVAVRLPSGGLYFKHSAGAGDHFEQLPGLVRSVCAEASLELSNLAQLRVGVGPGSFTGLRIGMSFAKGLAFALRIPCLWVCSFFAAASARMLQGAASERITVLADARRSELFHALYDVTNGEVRVVSSPEIVSHADGLARYGRGGLHITPQLELQLQGLDVSPEPAIARGMLSTEASQVGFALADIASLEPFYLRDVSAKTIEQRRLQG